MTLFLDRDGVINRLLPGRYVERVEEFEFLPDVLDALARLAPVFDKIVVVTNQAGIGKGLMTEQDLAAIHQHMRQTIAAHGGRLDAVYHCPNHPDDAAICRKPAPGMAWRAQQDFPGIRYEASWIVGDAPTDIQLGQQLGMRTALVLGKQSAFEEGKALRPDWSGASLAQWTEWFLGAVR
jgi:histidinol-phosphate phosphatase family protein